MLPVAQPLLRVRSAFTQECRNGKAEPLRKAWGGAPHDLGQLGQPGLHAPFLQLTSRAHRTIDPDAWKTPAAPELNSLPKRQLSISG